MTIATDEARTSISVNIVKLHKLLSKCSIYNVQDLYWFGGLWNFVCFVVLVLLPLELDLICSVHLINRIYKNSLNTIWC